MEYPFQMCHSVYNCPKSTAIDTFHFGKPVPWIWAAPSMPIGLTTDSLHVWAVKVSDYVDDLKQLYRLLSDEETRQANKFQFPEDRARYIVARGFLRKIIHRYCLQSPESIQFGCTTFGKPFLAGNYSFDLQFNISHAKNWVLYALSLFKSVGVDVEFWRYNSDMHRSDMHRLVNNYFSKTEVEEYLRLPDDLKEAAFYFLWTQKEAYTKARGQGLAYPLNQFSVLCNPHHTQTWLRIGLEGSDLHVWSVYPFPVAHRYFGAVAIQGEPVTIYYMRW